MKIHQDQVIIIDQIYILILKKMYKKEHSLILLK